MESPVGQQKSRPRWSLSKSGLLTIGPGLAWISFFLIVPLASIMVIAFLSRGPYGEIKPQFTLENFARFIGYGSFGLYPKIVLRSLIMASATLAVCLAVAVPLTFFITALPARWKQAALMLVVIPFWTNLLIRTYAWQIILSAHGWLARAGAALGLIPPGEALFPSTFAVLIVLVCDYLPVLVLPLYASVEKIDWTLAEAASDLGANGPRVFRHALLPQIKPGLVAGSILVFIAATGQFAIPDLLGGAKTVLLGNAIQQQFGFSRDWPFGSAIACFAMAIMMIGLWWYARASAEEQGRAKA
jgi:spermidine/putrescine transport system permease protein